MSETTKEQRDEVNALMKVSAEVYAALVKTFRAAGLNPPEVSFILTQLMVMHYKINAKPGTDPRLAIDIIRRSFEMEFGLAKENPPGH